MVLLLGVGCTTTTTKILSGKTEPNPSYIDLSPRTFSEEETKTIIANYHKGPNAHYQDMTDVLFFQLKSENPLLARELGKLPEFQNGVSPSEAEALEDIVNLYRWDKGNFDKAFQQMYKFGLPEVREYCSPLQALLWTAEKEEFNESNNPISKGISDIYLKLFLKIAWGDMEGRRWRNFNKVTSRLNDPKLIDIYTRKVFKYHDVGFITRPPTVIFHNKKGHCLDYSLFIEHCLDKGGYEAHVYDQPHKPHKFVGYIDKDNKWYVIDNGGRFRPKGILGPFKSEEELKKRFSCARYYGAKRF